ncbi:MAG: rRNA maturation RNase YbeY [Bacteroidales bacterium]
MALRVDYQNEKFRLRGKRKILAWLEGVLNSEGSEAGDIAFIFTDDNYLREINRKFLEHDYFTDVITFDYSTARGIIEGEIYISSDTVRENSKIYNTGMEMEILRVMVHGLLHLTGYDDKSEGERKLMREKEDYYLSRRVD